MKAALISFCLGTLLLAAEGCADTDTITQKLQIGSPCKVSSDCGSQPQFYCDQSQPLGYCTKSCDSDKDCPTEAICVFSGATGTCHSMCDVAQTMPPPCRPMTGDYECVPASTNVSTLASHAYCVGTGAPDGGAGGDMATPLDGATGN